MQDKITKVVTDSLKELNEELKNRDFENPTLETPLYGTNGNLDSLALVNLVVDLEGKIFEEFEKSVALVSERAFSQEHSPFQNVGRLTTYIHQLLEET